MTLNISENTTGLKIIFCITQSDYWFEGVHDGPYKNEMIY